MCWEICRGFLHSSLKSRMLSDKLVDVTSLVKHRMHVKVYSNHHQESDIKVTWITCRGEVACWSNGFKWRSREFESSQGHFHPSFHRPRCLARFRQRPFVQDAGLIQTLPCHLYLSWKMRLINDISTVKTKSKPVKQRLINPLRTLSSLNGRCYSQTRSDHLGYWPPCACTRIARCIVTREWNYIIIYIISSRIVYYREMRMLTGILCILQS